MSIHKRALRRTESKTPEMVTCGPVSVNVKVPEGINGGVDCTSYGHMAVTVNAYGGRILIADKLREVANGVASVRGDDITEAVIVVLLRSLRRAP